MSDPSSLIPADVEPSEFKDWAEAVSQEAEKVDTHDHDGDYAADGHDHDLGDLGDVDASGGSDGDVLTQQGDGSFALETPSGGGSDLSDDDPAGLGTAASGTGGEASRDDHVHAMPSAGDVGASPSSHDHDAAYAASGHDHDSDYPSQASFDDHSARHESGGADEVDVGGLSGELADPQPAKSHASAHEPGGSDALSVDAAAGVGSLRTLGTGSQQAAAGDHAHDDTYAQTVGDATSPITSKGTSRPSGDGTKIWFTDFSSAGGGVPDNMSAQDLQVRVDEGES